MIVVWCEILQMAKLKSSNRYTYTKLSISITNLEPPDIANPNISNNHFNYKIKDEKEAIDLNVNVLSKMKKTAINKCGIDVQTLLVV